MAGFLDRAKEQAQSALSQGKEKVEEVQAQREGAALLKKLGQTYAQAQRGTGSEDAVQQALQAVNKHAEEHGEDFLSRA